MAIKKTIVTAPHETLEPHAPEELPPTAESVPDVPSVEGVADVTPTTESVETVAEPPKPKEAKSNKQLGLQLAVASENEKYKRIYWCHERVIAAEQEVTYLNSQLKEAKEALRGAQLNLNQAIDDAKHGQGLLVPVEAPIDNEESEVTHGAVAENLPVGDATLEALEQAVNEAEDDLPELEGYADVPLDGEENDFEFPL